MRWIMLAVLALSIWSARMSAAGETVGGWRGNGTGVWRGGNPALRWNRIPHGATEGLRVQLDRPADGTAGDAALVHKGQIREWLVLGPFAVGDSIAELDRDPLDGESSAAPSRGERLADRVWTVAALNAIDDATVFGTAAAPWLDLAKAVGFQTNQFAYAPPLVDGDRIYLRGERYLYCVAAKTGN